MKRKQIVSLFLAVVLLLALAAPVCAASPGLSNFKKQTEYTGFSDVPSSAWYAESVKTVCEYGLMQGAGSGKFNPSGYITFAETRALMCRLHNIYNGGSGSFDSTSPWYAAYDTYAGENDLPYAGFLDSSLWSSVVTRGLFVDDISHAIPKSEFKAINSVCPSGSSGSESLDTIYRFFNAGVLTGSSVDAGFDGGSVITRAEVATILVRIIDPSKRFDASKQVLPEKYVVNTAWGVKSVWALSFGQPGDSVKFSDGTVVTYTQGKGYVAKRNGLSYAVDIDVDTAKQDPLWSVYFDTAPEDDGEEVTASTSPTTSAEAPTTPPANCDYVINTNTNKFHYPWCKYVARMAEKNKQYYTGSRNSLVPTYSPCKVCKP